MYTSADLAYMKLALEEAQKALFISNPNPRVGCVIVKDGQVIGQGHTQVAGGPHAEVVAIAHATAQGFSIEDATVYVTLEPCCHHGRTPPCIDALIAGKVRKVIAAMEDPNPLVAGNGLHRLKDHGIDVRCGLYEKEATQLNIGFVKRMTTGFPWVRLKIAASLDATSALHNGVSQWITGEEARLDGHRWRAQACAILTGIGTTKEDNPQLNVRGIETPRQPLRVLVDSKLEIALDANILKGGNTLVVCANPDPSHMERMKVALNARGASLLQLPNPHGKVDLPALFKYLGEELQLNEIHVEAGNKLNGSLIRENCVDELLLYYAPTLLGSGLGIAQLGPLNSLEDRFDWSFIDHTLIGADLRLRLIKINSSNED